MMVLKRKNRSIWKRSSRKLASVQYPWSATLWRELPKDLFLFSEDESCQSVTVHLNLKPSKAERITHLNRMMALLSSFNILGCKQDRRSSWNTAILQWDAKRSVQICVRQNKYLETCTCSYANNTDVADFGLLLSAQFGIRLKETVAMPCNTEKLQPSLLWLI